MEMNINHELRIESKVPFQSVEDFQFEWKTNQHAVLEMNGYIDAERIYGKDSLYGSKISIWKEQGKVTLFHGYVTTVLEESAGELKKIHIEAQSASARLDQKTGKRSFQAVGKTYAEVAREAVEDNEGQIICTAGNDKQVGRPVIQYNETVWTFAKRLASHLGACVVADIISGEPAVWFGMRNGNTIPPFPENEYSINVVRTMDGDGNSTETVYETESREFYKIGDRMVFCGQRLIICGVSAYFRQGELVFKYLLKSRESVQKLYQESFIGLGLTGTVVDVKNEQVKVALDIDGGKSTGDYYYDWYPETGNALYAMPEKGARVELCFGSWDEQEGYCVRCFFKCTDSRAKYKNKSFRTINGNFVDLYFEDVSFFGEKYGVALYNEHISIRSLWKINILAEKTIQMVAAKMTIVSSGELNFCKG